MKSAHQVVGEVAQRGHGLDVLLAVGAVPDGQQRADPGPGNIDGTGQQGIIDCSTAGQLSPVDLDIDALLLAVLFNQVLIAHHIEQQVNNAELLGNADFTFGPGDIRRHKAAGKQADTQAQTCGHGFERCGHGNAP